ncbi:uncharacterized protein K02A2.6-like [Myzus persicae]|uniref:uncharacterized protein K02A2.6-like n=1 Tax=Myzus persicae TaxID=13164 RepID=UPI000B93971E|nr:uncharacterized protein K02A2.6-like [Myzus persicae]
MTKTWLMAKQLFYWPCMKKDIESFIESCNVCLKFSCSKVKEPMLCHDIPELPYTKIGMDIAQFQGKNYIVVNDYFSRWLEVEEIRGKTTSDVVEKLKKIFSRFGIPKNIWDIQLITSSPYFHQSNGLAEKSVDIVKGMLKKIGEEGGDLNIYLLNYRNTPITGLNYSPAQLLQSRRLRSLIMNYNKNAGKEEKEFYVGQKVYIQNALNKKWFPGIIVNKTKYPRSYIVKDVNDKILRRNSKFIKKVKDYDLVNGFDDEINMGEKKDNILAEKEKNNINVQEKRDSNITRYGRKIKKVERYGYNKF